MEETGRVPTVQEKNRKVYKSNSRLDSRIKYNGQELNPQCRKAMLHLSMMGNQVFFRFDHTKT